MCENTRNCRYRSSNVIVFTVFVILRKPFKRGKWPASFISLNLKKKIWMIQGGIVCMCMCVCVCVCVHAHAQSCPTLCDPMDCSLPGSSLHGISQARILQWIAISSSRVSSWPRDQTCIIFNSCTTSGFFTAEPPWRDSKMLIKQTTWELGKEVGREYTCSLY